MAEAGWYYVEGDPPGTVRRWNGVEWIGFPIPDPSGQVDATGTRTLATSAPGAAASTRKRFNSGDQILTILTVLSLAVLAGLFGLAALRWWQGAEAMPSTGRFRSGDVDDLSLYIQGLSTLPVAISVVAVLSGLLFIPWVRISAATAQIHRMKGGSYGSGSKPTRPPIVLLIILFLMFPGIVIAWILLNQAVSGVARGPNRKSGMLAVVSDIAVAASTDPQTGVTGISPIKIMIWWAFWWLPIVVSVLSWIVLWIQSPITDTFLVTIVQLHVIVFALEAISLLCIIATITQVSARLWR